MTKAISLSIAAMLYTLSCFSQNKDKAIAPPADPSQTFTYVDQMPEPTFNLNEYLSKNIVYPKDAMDLEIQGRVVVKFVVMETGKVDSVKVIRSVYPSIDSTAISVVQKMPLWKPGKNNGKDVRVHYTLPIGFKLEEQQKKTEPAKK